jgi:hypothetical protein
VYADCPVFSIIERSVQRQLQTQHNADIGNKIKSKPHNNNNNNNNNNNINNINSIHSQLQS